APAAVPMTVMTSTIRAVLAAVDRGTAPIVSAKVLALTDGAVKTLTVGRIKIAAAIVLLSLGVGLAAFATYAGTQSDEKQSALLAPLPKQSGSREATQREERPPKERDEGAREALSGQQPTPPPTDESFAPPPKKAPEPPPEPTDPVGRLLVEWEKATRGWETFAGELQR